MEKVHRCDKDVHDQANTWYEEKSNTWWLTLGFGSCAIEYCPFCGKELRAAEFFKGGQHASNHRNPA